MIVRLLIFPTESLFLEKKSIARELTQRTAVATSVRKRQQRLIKKLRMTKEHRRTFAIAQDIVSLKAYRKDCSFHGFFVLLEYLFPEIARRATVPVKHLLLYTDREIVRLLDQKKVLPASQVTGPQEG